MNSGSINFRYQVLQMIASSSMSTVYKVWDASSKKILALKASLNCGERCSEKVLAKEFFILSKYNHPRIVQALNLDFASSGAALMPGTVFFTMEYMRGKTLDKARNLTYHSIEDILLQLLAAMKVIHEAGIVYGDMKPHNIMVLDRKELQIKLFDFGLAMREGVKVDGKEISGTLLYIAPEMLRGGEIDRRTDLYSLGAMLYEMVTGFPPFYGKDAISVAYGHLMELPLNPSSLNPSIPKRLKIMIMRLLQKDPGRRFQNVDEVLSYMGRQDRKGWDLDPFRVLEKGTARIKESRKRLFLKNGESLPLRLFPSSGKMKPRSFS